MTEINVTPLVDVMLVLLIIFMVTAPLIPAIKVDLPNDPAPATEPAPATVKLSIDAAGAVYWDDQPLADAELAKRMAAAAKATALPEVHVRADKATRYERIAFVLSRTAPPGRPREDRLRHRTHESRRRRRRQVAMRALALVVATSLALGGAAAAAAKVAVDDEGRTVELAQPARRIVSIAPHLTEQLFAIGAGDLIVGTTDFADFPAAAAGLPRVARAHSVDLERVSAARPDLILIWGSGFPPATIDAVRRLGVPTFVSEPARLADIATSLQRLGTLTARQADRAAGDFNAKLGALRERYRGRREIRVFYQVWSDPLMTLGGRHVISEAISVCGGRNVFANLTPIAPRVSTEAVLERSGR